METVPRRSAPYRPNSPACVHLNFGALHMIPFELMPGAARWAAGLPGLVSHTGPLWVWGPFGSGTTTLSRWLAAQRGVEAIEYDPPDAAGSPGPLKSPDPLGAWLAANPLGVVASDRPPGRCPGTGGAFLELRLWTLDDDPGSILPCLESLAPEEGVEPPLPAALAALPCVGNLRELRNRLIRWHTLGQLPEPPRGGPALLEAEDVATNLHILERTLLHRALRRSFGRRGEAAHRLGVSHRQLYILIARHGDPVRGQPPDADPPKRLKKKL